MNNSAMRLSAAVTLALVTNSPVAAAKLQLPPPTAPKDRIYSAGAIAKSLEKRGYRIEKMKRMGTTYSVTATGRSGNKVQLTVDGRSGDIIGLAVLNPVANLVGAIAALLTSNKGTRYIDDWHPFGIIIPDIYQTRWTVIPTTSWRDYSVAYVTEPWVGSGYRFAVPYNTIRPGYNGYSVTTLEVSELGNPVYDIYDSGGVEISTEYAEESVEITEATSFETTYAEQNEQMAESYLGGAVADEDFDVAEIGDMDVSDADDFGEDTAMDAGDDSGNEAMEPGEEPAGLDPGADPDEAVDDPDDSEPGIDDVDEPDEHADEPDMSGNLDEPDDLGDDAGDDPGEPEDDFGSDDSGGDDGGGDYDDGGGEPDTSRAD
jgi:hypothetical protein